jgi:hypothetical protein
MFASSASAETLITCHKPKGQRYAQGSGWFSDGFSNGKFSLIRNGKEFDILFTDFSGTRSSRSDGAVVIVSEKTTDAMTVIAAYPRALETYLFDFFQREMLMTSMKISTGVKTAAVFFSKCE